MPVPGPNNREMYRPYEAYNLIGRKVYGQEWQSTFSGQGRLPDQQIAKRILKRGGRDAELLRAFGDPSDQEYEDIQSGRFRESYVLDRLLEALRWGKTEAHLKENDGTWRPVSLYSWEEGSEAADLLRKDLLATVGAREPGSRRLLIEKAPLDKWIPNITKPNDVAPAIEDESGNIGRPGADWKAFRAELQRLNLAGELPALGLGWRRSVGKQLQNWYKGAFPELPTKKVPQVQTIIRRLRPELVQIEHKLKVDKGK